MVRRRPFLEGNPAFNVLNSGVFYGPNWTGSARGRFSPY